MTKKDRKLIEKYLPEDYAKSIGAKLKFSADYVRAVKRGDRVNQMITDCIIEEAAKNKKKIDTASLKRSKNIQALLS